MMVIFQSVDGIDTKDFLSVSCEKNIDNEWIPNIGD